MHVPVDVLARLGGDEFAWQVPALREELITELIRSLPKELRRNFVPAPDTARAVLAGIRRGAAGPVLTAPSSVNYAVAPAFWCPIDAFDLDKLPAHLRVTFAVESTPTAPKWGAARICRRFSSDWRASARRAVADTVAAGLERTGLRSWPDDLERLPATIERTIDGRAVRGIPLSSMRAAPSTCGCLRRRVEQQARRWGPAFADCYG